MVFRSDRRVMTPLMVHVSVIHALTIPINPSCKSEGCCLGYEGLSCDDLLVIFIHILFWRFYAYVA